MKKILVLVLCLGLFGCAMLEIDPAISKYKAVAPKIKLGDSKEDVLSLLVPTQKSLSGSASKSPEAYIQDGNTVEIYYFRSGRQPDGITTDDEFTPYIFTNGKLTGIGWSVLGGAKSHGQVIQPAPVTNIQQNQSTTVY